MTRESDVKLAFELAKQQQQNSRFSCYKARLLKAGAQKMYDKWKKENQGKTLKFK